MAWLCARSEDTRAQQIVHVQSTRDPALLVEHDERSDAVSLHEVHRFRRQRHGTHHFCVAAHDLVHAGGVQIRGSIQRATQIAVGALRYFMLKFTREKDLALLTEIAHLPRPRAPSDLPMRVVIPAYILSELKTGFQIGAVLFLPFLVIDLVTASVTTSIGMLQLPPVVISTPLKILLFVVVDGWNLVVGSMLRSFHY